MKTQCTDKVTFGADVVHGYAKGQHTPLNGKRVVITRTKGQTVWFRPETLKEKLNRLFGRFTRRAA